MKIPNLRTVTISGSYQKFPDLIAITIEQFKDLGVKVLSPQSAKIVTAVEGFVSIKGDIIEQLNTISPNEIFSAIRTIENNHLRAIQESDVLWVVMPKTYVGIATAFEIGWAIAHQVPIYALQSHMTSSKEPIAKAYVNQVGSIDELVANYPQADRIAPPSLAGYAIINACTTIIKKEQKSLNSTIAVGAIIEDHTKKYAVDEQREILLVRTHKWGGRISIVGGRIQSGQDLDSARLQKVKEQIGVVCEKGNMVCAFNELPNSGYYQPCTNRVFIDAVVKSDVRNVRLNDDASEYIWTLPDDALRELDIEPNARKTIELYVGKSL